jgi:hypothetical protein
VEGLPAQAPARVDSIDSGRDIWKVVMCVSKVNKKQWYLVSACLTSAPRTENRMVVRLHARALEAAGEGRNARGTILEDSLEPQSLCRCLLWLASSAHLSSSSWPAPSPKSCAARAIEGESCAVQSTKANQDIQKTNGSFRFAQSSLSVECAKLLDCCAEGQSKK